LVWALFFLIVGSSQTFQSCIGEHYHHESSETFQKGVTQFLIVVKAGSACTGEFVHKNAESIIALFTVILGIATWFLWRATKRLVEGAENTAERQLRAYVSNPVAAEIKRFNTATPFIQLGFKNSGQTPAHNMRIWTRSAVSIYPLANPPDPPDGGPISMGVIGPNSDFHISIESDIPVTDDERQRVVAGDAAFYVYGHLAYDDAFGKPRETTFCVFYRGEVAKSPSGRLATYQKWNNAS
jgi:hypothetical protein